MDSCNNSDLRNVPSVLETARAPTLARAVDWLAGPLALAAAGLTFFAAYDLTVTQPADLFTGMQPTLVHTVAAQVTAPMQPDGSGAANGHSRVSEQENSKTMSMLTGATPTSY